MYWLRKLFTDGSTHLRAAGEAFILFVFSVAPFGVTVLIRMRTHQDDPIALYDLFSRGQLFLLAYALFGPIFWLAFVRWDRPRHNARTALGVLALFLLIPLVALMGVDPTFSTTLNYDLVLISFYFYGSLLLIRYLLTFYINIDPPVVSEILGREADVMRDRYREMRDVE